MKKNTFPITTKNKSGVLLVNREKDIIESAVQLPTNMEKFKYYWGGIGWLLFKSIYRISKMKFDITTLDITDGPVGKLSTALNSKSDFFALKSKPYNTLNEQEKFTLTLFENLYRDYHFEDHTGIETFADFNANPLYVLDIILSGIEISDNETIRFALDSFLYELIIISVQENLSVQMKCLGVINDEYTGVVRLADIAKSSFLIKQPEEGKITMDDILEFGDVDNEANEETSKIMVNKQLAVLGEGTIGAIAPGMSIKELFQKVNTGLQIESASKDAVSISETTKTKPSKDNSPLGWDDIF